MDASVDNSEAVTRLELLSQGGIQTLGVPGLPSDDDNKVDSLPSASAVHRDLRPGESQDFRC